MTDMNQAILFLCVSGGKLDLYGSPTEVEKYMYSAECKGCSWWQCDKSPAIKLLKNKTVTSNDWWACLKPRAVTRWSVTIPCSSGSVLPSSHQLSADRAEVVRCSGPLVLHARCWWASKRCTSNQLGTAIETFIISGMLPAFLQEVGHDAWTQYY